MAKKPALFLILILLIIGAGAAYWWNTSHAQEAKNAASNKQAAPPTSVAIKTLEVEKINITYSLPGRITPFRQSQVRPQVDGIVIERLFEEGADVEKGQQLYQIDDARFKASLNSAMADLKSAKASVKTIEARAERYKDLVKINAVSKQEYDDAVAELDQAKASIAVAQAAVDMAQVNLDYTKVYAPITGRISRSFVTEGALVTANQSQHLATITQIDPVYIDMQQSGTAALSLRSRTADKEAIPVRVMVDEKTGEYYPAKGELKFSEVTVDETTGSITLRALIPNSNGVLMPGLFVRAELEIGEEKVILVPQRATTRNADGSLTLWVIDQDNKAQKRSIEVTQTYKDDWVIQSGVHEGERVIITGYQKVAEGTTVSPSPWQKTPSPAAASKQASKE